MKKPIKHLQLLPFLLFGLIWLSGCGSQPALPEASVTPTPLLSATKTSTPDADDAGQTIFDAVGLDIVPTLAGMAPTRTPAPTATPDALTQGIIDILQETDLYGKTLFRLTYSNWINLGLSLLFILIGYLLGTWVIRWLLPRLVNRTKTRLDDYLLRLSGDQVRWLVVVLILRFAVKRLTFVNADIKTFIIDVCFFLIVFLIAWLLWRLIGLTVQQAEVRARRAGHQKEAKSLITLMAWGLRLLVVLFVLVMILIHFSVNFSGFAFIVGGVALIFSLAGRDIFADIISGAMILIDRPYRIGDRLELPALDSWGDVIEIGMRSTKILSVENRMVVVPNSQIGKNQVVNYSYPDPAYCNFIDVFVAYDNDPDQVAEIIVAAIRSVEGVQLEREVLALLHIFDQYSMGYWASWWVADYADRYPVQDKVSRAIVRALREAKVALPFQKGQFNVLSGPIGHQQASRPEPSNESE